MTPAAPRFIRKLTPIARGMVATITLRWAIAALAAAIGFAPATGHAARYVTDDPESQ